MSFDLRLVNFVLVNILIHRVFSISDYRFRRSALIIRWSSTVSPKTLKLTCFTNNFHNWFLHELDSDWYSWTNWLLFFYLIFLVIMVALRNRADHYIFILWFLLLLLLFLARLISAVARWMSVIYFHTWCGLSANLRCRSEMCCTRLAENTGCKKVAKNRHLGTIAQLCRAISSQLRYVSTIGKTC